MSSMERVFVGRCERPAGNPGENTSKSTFYFTRCAVESLLANKHLKQQRKKTREKNIGNTKAIFFLPMCETFQNIFASTQKSVWPTEKTLRDGPLDQPNFSTQNIRQLGRILSSRGLSVNVSGRFLRSRRVWHQ